MTDQRYPTGKFEPQPYSEHQRDLWMADIAALPSLMEDAIQPLDQSQLDTPYREGGWTVQQLVHHVADSHMNAYVRFKLGLTEDTPTIKPYDENAWAKLSDVQLPVRTSISLLHALHLRWMAILEAVPTGDWETRSVIHPEKGTHITLWSLLGLYAWHGKHHLAHITSLKSAQGW
jgi:uncharacterized damage-inducible protein DinB